MTSFTNAAGKTEYTHVKDWKYIPVFHPVPKSTQSGSKT
jgi:hypothetical protein